MISFPTVNLQLGNRSAYRFKNDNELIVGTVFASAENVFLSGLASFLQLYTYIFRSCAATYFCLDPYTH